MRQAGAESVTVSQLPARIPGRVGLSSDTCDWNNIFLRRYFNPPVEALVPGLEDFWIAIHIGKPIQIRYDLGDGQRTGWAHRGSVTIVPIHAPGRWQLSGPADVLHLYVGAQLIFRTMEQVFDRDPLQLNLIDRLAVHDPLIEQIGLALLTELEVLPEATSSRLYVESLTHALAVHLIRHHTADQPPERATAGALSHRKLQQLLAYLDANLDKDVSLAALAALVDLSPYHFARVFRSCTGLSPHQYVLRQRINIAKNLLMHGELTIAEIAYKVGFSSQSHFTTTFHKWVGTTPASYRRAVAKNGFTSH